MRLTKKQNGYTIVETMIVLAVTSAMLTATAMLVSGQIARYRFRDATYNSRQAIQSAINDVQSGYFDKRSSLPPGCTPSNPEPYGNTNCVYVGKKIEITNTGSMIATPLYLINNSPPSSPGNIPRVLLDSANTSQLPGGVDYGPATEFYVMFRNYPDTTAGGTFVGGAQSVGVFDSSIDLTSQNNLPRKVNLVDGSRNACLEIGKDNGLDVTLEYVVCVP
jgi:type II secretory pathway pseudopilin PulG